MKTKTNKRFWKFFLVFLSIGLLSGYLIGSAVKSKSKSDAIIEILRNECQCNEVNQIIYAEGIQFGANGISTEKGEYQLIDCNYESLDIEANRINEMLKKQVKKFKDIDQLELEFINKNRSETVVIKNGIIQKSKN